MLRWEHLCAHLSFLGLPGSSWPDLLFTFIPINPPQRRRTRLQDWQQTSAWHARTQMTFGTKTWYSVEGLHVRTLNGRHEEWRQRLFGHSHPLPMLRWQSRIRIGSPGVRWPEFRFRAHTSRLDDGWRGACDFPSPSFHFLSSVTLYLQGLGRGSFKKKCVGGGGL